VDIFEYGLICLVFKDEGETTKGFVRVTFYEFKGDVPVPKNTNFPLTGNFVKTEHTERLDKGDGYYTIRDKSVVASGNLNYSIGVIMPYLAIYGKFGWEAIGYKTDSDPVFGQVLLKRRVQK